MPVSTTNAIDGPYIANGVTTSFPFTFTAPTAGEVMVLLRDADGVETTVSPDDYVTSVVDTGGGTVAFVVPPATGNEVFILLDVDFTQELDFQDGDRWLARPVEEGYNRSAARDQVLKRELDRAVRVPFGEDGLIFPSSADRLGKFIGFSPIDGAAIASEGTDANSLLAVDLATGTAGKGAELVATKASGTGAVARLQADKNADFRTLEDFGAVGYNSFGDATDGDDSTDEIQAAIDWASSGGTTARGLRVTANFFKCGNITLPNSCTLRGSGRQVSGFVAKAGTTGKWFSAPVSAQKICLSDLCFYGNNETGITHIMELVTGQHGTEGILKSCWFRNAPEGYGLDYNGNVGYLHDITCESVKFGARLQGNGNKYSTFTMMQCGEAAADPSTAIALQMTGAHMVGLHIEAPASGSLPLYLRADSKVTGATISFGPASTFSHAVEIYDTASFSNYGLHILDVFNPGSATITNGVLKQGTDYFYGTDATSLKGLELLAKANVTGGDFRIKNAKMQGMKIRIATTAGGVLQHRIGSMGGSDIAGSFYDKVNGANVSLQNTPTGGAAFAFGASVTASGNGFVLDIPDQLEPDAFMQAVPIYNNTGTPLVIFTYVSDIAIGGVTQKRLVLEFRDNNATAVSLTGLGASKLIEVALTAFLK